MKTAWWIWQYGAYLALAVNMFAFVLPGRLRGRTKFVWTVVLAVCCLKPLIFEKLGGDVCTPEFADWAIFLLEWGYFGALILSVLCLVWWRRGREWLLPAAAFGISLWGMLGGLVLPSVREVEFRYAELPQELDGYRILQISDLHASAAARRWRTQAIVDRANAQKADLICLTGDYADGEAEYSAPFVEPIRGLRAKDGVWAVTGNHEYLNPSAEWKKRYDRWGIRFLVNECVFPRKSLALGGVNDLVARWRGTSVYGPQADVGQAFASATNGEFRLLMQHDPLTAERNLRELGVDLQLSGHTHGFFFPGLGRLLSKHYGGFVRGTYRYGDGVLYVNPACGQWRGFPMRFLNPQELTLVTLRRGR